MDRSADEMSKAATSSRWSDWLQKKSEERHRRPLAAPNYIRSLCDTMVYMIYASELACSIFGMTSISDCYSIEQSMPANAALL
jgi:hypothetical protein